MKRFLNVILTLVFIALIFLFAVAVPSGSLNDEAADRYREEQMTDGDDSWLLQY